MKGRGVQDSSSSASEIRRSGERLVLAGLVGIVIVVLAAFVLLFMNLPNAGVFNAEVERIFVENDALTAPSDIKLLEILAQSGTAFSKTLASYRVVVFVLLVFSTALLITALVFIVMLLGMARRLRQIERTGMEINALLVARDENTVYLNDHGFKLTEAAMETMSVLAEARLDEEVLTGAQIEAVISGRAAADCEEAAGATRIKRLRDALGNQLISALLVKNIARRGYMLAVDKSVIKME